MELHLSLSIVLASSVEGGVNTPRADMRDAVHCADWCRPFQPLMQIANRTILQLVMPGNLFFRAHCFANMLIIGFNYKAIVAWYTLYPARGSPKREFEMHWK